MQTFHEEFYPLRHLPPLGSLPRRDPQTRDHDDETVRPRARGAVGPLGQERAVPEGVVISVALRALVALVALVALRGHLPVRLGVLGVLRALGLPRLVRGVVPRSDVSLRGLPALGSLEGRALVGTPPPREGRRAGRRDGRVGEDGHGHVREDGRLGRREGRLGRAGGHGGGPLGEGGAERRPRVGGPADGGPRDLIPDLDRGVLVPAAHVVQPEEAVPDDASVCRPSVEDQARTPGHEGGARLLSREREGRVEHAARRVELDRVAVGQGRVDVRVVLVDDGEVSGVVELQKLHGNDLHDLPGLVLEEPDRLGRESRRRRAVGLPRAAEGRTGRGRPGGGRPGGGRGRRDDVCRGRLLGGRRRAVPARLVVAQDRRRLLLVRRELHPRHGGRGGVLPLAVPVGLVVAQGDVGRADVVGDVPPGQLVVHRVGRRLGLPLGGRRLDRDHLSCLDLDQPDLDRLDLNRLGGYHLGRLLLGGGGGRRLDLRLLDRLEEAEAPDDARVAVDGVVAAGPREVERELERGRGAAAEVRALPGRSGGGEGRRQQSYSSRHGRLVGET
mmetsp:Transcript_38403/g.86480  ORF Transcript_38403/g.86480 Transcript_38403/m.86480 type:complete len:559 (-) Transcript_38403:57-1733(-)